jgi:hypothetical protein
MPTEELSVTAELSLRAGPGPIKVPLPEPVQSKVSDRDGIDRRVEIIVAFTSGTLKLAAPPGAYPARPR